MQSASTEERVKTQRVWDPLVRIGHWVLVAAFATAYLSEGEPEWLHVWAGYAIAITVGLRILWGFVGPRRARFSDFVTGPVQVVRYLGGLVTGRSERYVGHSPAGGAMTLALLAALIVTAFSGMATLAVEEGRGPLAGIITGAPTMGALTPPGGFVGKAIADEKEEAGEVGEGAEGGREGGEGGFWSELHEASANVTLALIIVHLAGVALASLVHRENLVAAMFTGRKRV